MDTISDRIKAGLEFNNMNQADIVRNTGINKGALSSYISGKYQPKRKNAVLIASALGVSEEWLLGMDNPLMTLGQIIKNYRDANTLTMQEFADKSGLTKGYISMLEKNHNPISQKPIAPSLKTIKQVAKAMGISFNSLFNMLGTNQEVLLEEKDTPNFDMPALNNNTESLEHQQEQSFSIFLENKTALGIGDRILNLRKSKNMSRADLGLLVGLHETTIKKYEDGQIKSLTTDKIEKFANALNVNPANIVGWEQPVEEDLANDMNAQDKEFFEIVSRLTKEQKDFLYSFAETLLKQSEDKNKDKV